MRDQQAIVKELIDLRIVLGPDHFVLGDGYGNPGYHTSLFVDWSKFSHELNIYAEMVDLLAARLTSLDFDMIMTTDEESLPTARMLSRVLAELHGRPPATCGIYEGCAIPDHHPVRVLLHDDFINRGRRISEILLCLDRAHYTPVAISALFQRVPGPHFYQLPIYAALDRPMMAYPPEEMPESLAKVPVNTQHGKGGAWLTRRKAG